MTERKHSHYFRPFPYDDIDIYRFLEVFDVACPVAQHIIKKAVATGKRGHKDLQRDWQDIVDSAQRKLEMLDENDLIWWGSSKEDLEKIALENVAHNTPQSTPNDICWFDASEQELGEAALAAAQEKPWYPDDIPSLEWKEVNGEYPATLHPDTEIFTLLRRERKERKWSCYATRAGAWDWTDTGGSMTLVAYAVKKG